MPTAVRIESIENTMSSSRICTMAEAKFIPALSGPENMSGPGWGSTE